MNGHTLGFHPQTQKLNIVLDDSDSEIVKPLAAYLETVELGDHKGRTTEQSLRNTFTRLQCKKLH